MRPELRNDSFADYVSNNDLANQMIANDQLNKLPEEQSANIQGQI